MTLHTPNNLYRRGLVAAQLLLLTAGLAVAGQLSPEPAPQFSLESNGGAEVSLQDYSGQVVMINFWASWCGPCRQEMPLLEDLYQRYEPLGFTLLGVNVDEDTSAAVSYLQEVSVSFPVLFDTASTVSEAYDVIAMPSTILIGRDGKLRYIHHGYQPGYENEYQNQIRELIRE